MCTFLLLLGLVAARAELSAPLRAVMEQTLPVLAQPGEGPRQDGTLEGKVLCGYQGWFTTEKDGAQRPWVHWTKGKGGMVDGNAKVDLWPDLSEFPPEERFATGFKFADGRVAEVFSSMMPATVHRHFRWMREAGIDGAFVQRFAPGLRNEAVLRDRNTVLAHCREGARREGRVYAVMYDLSGLGAGRIQEVMDDWRALKRQLQPDKDAAYLKHRGRPLVAVWGVGFKGDRAYTLAECRELVEFLQHDPEAGGNTVMLGVPTGWRTLNRDAAADPALLELLAKVEVISPWTVGRYQTPEQAARHGQEVVAPDLQWCRERGVDYLPVVFPGFSWANMNGGKLGQIPRLGGRFFWQQMVAGRRAGASMLYVAMFDEVDEGTAIFKCATEVPVGEQSRFVSYEGVAPDFYLWLSGQGRRLIRGEIPARDELPERKP